MRELQNVIERSVIVCDTDEFRIDGSWLSTAPPAKNSRVLSSSLAGHERTIIEDALRASGGRVFGPSGAAARLGIARALTTLVEDQLIALEETPALIEALMRGNALAAFGDAPPVDRSLPLPGMSESAFSRACS